ncbi:MAG: choline-sulfatase [Gammaproteobacteria bacterium]|jgi:choline-sulfatase
MSQKTNILVIQADQLAANCLGVYGHSLVKTPHIDALAEKAIVFDSAYTNFPLCAPSRFSMLTGQLASTIEAYDNGAEFPSSLPTINHYLRKLNYQTCLVGKMHFVGADQLHGFEERLTTDLYPADFGWTGDWTEAKPEHSNDASTFTKAGICLRNSQIEYDDEVCHRAKRKIYELARGNDERPFFLFTSFTHPHDPFQARPQHWNLYHPDDILEPTIAADQDAMDPYSKRLAVQYRLWDNQPDKNQIRNARHGYYGSISYFDDLVGTLLQTLKECNLYDDTVIIITTDHGEMLGEHGLWYKKSFFEESCRVPLIISSPRFKSKRVKANVSLVDLLPTCLDIATNGHSPATVEPIDGNSLWSFLVNSDTNWSNPVYSENLAEGSTTPILMVKQDHFKYIHSDVDPSQLFNLEDDPHECHNLIDDPRYADRKSQLQNLVNKNWDVEALKDRILLSQSRRLFLRSIGASEMAGLWEYVPQDQVEKFCLRSDRTYGQWAYSDILDLHIPEQ